MNPQAFKKDLEDRLRRPDSFPAAYLDLKAHLRANRSVKEFHYGHKLLREFERDPQRSPFARKTRLAILTSYTSDFLYPLLKADLMLEDIGSELYEPKYNQVRQELLDAGSGLYSFQPDITIVAIELKDIFPEQTARFPVLAREEKESFRAEIVSLYESIVRSCRQNCKSPRSLLLVSDLATPACGYESLAGSEAELAVFVGDINKELESICGETGNTHVLRYSRLVEHHGRREWADPRLYFTANIPVGPQNWLHLSDAYVRYIKAALGIDIKCIVLDLDNTLWGGVLGEDGLDGIQLGDTYPGSVYRKFQEYLLGLYANGYILAINSRNNMDEVLDALRSHRGMLLKEHHFAAIRANWEEKAENMWELSRELNILPDHMLFVDDDPVQIEKVRLALPTVTCLRLDSPPLNFAEQFSQLRCFLKLGLTDEDKQRGELYVSERKRREIRQRVGSLEEFYRDLAQRLTIHRGRSSHVKRISQLTQKTNQFNMTTLRLTEAEVERLLTDPQHELITAELSDRLGDSGIIAYVQIRKAERVWEIENFLMSCRVLGRTAEECLLDYVVQRARGEGVESLRARFVPTAKNAPFAEFYLRNGFTLEKDGPAGEKYFVLCVAEYPPKVFPVEVIDDE